MKNQKALKISELALGILTVLFVILKNVWTGLSIVSYVFILALLVNSILLCVLLYKQTKKELKVEFADYLLEKYNQKQITKQQMEEGNDSLFKQYMQENKWELIKYIIAIVACGVLMLSTILSIIHYLTNL